MPAPAPALVRYAVIDIGSIAVRLQIATVAEGKLLTEVFTRIPLGLGGGTFNGRRREISARNCRRLADTISGMQLLIASMKPCRYSVVATAAVRDAINGNSVSDHIRQHCGIRLRILSGRAEATIIGCYAASHFPAAPAVLNADIGGGSTDCAIISGGKLQIAATFAIGTARPNGGSDEEKNRYRQWLQQHTPAQAVISSSGGSATQLQQLCGTLSETRLARWQKEINGLSVTELSARYDMSPDRAAHAMDAVDIYRLLLAASGGKNIQPVRGGLSEALIWDKLTAGKD